MGDPDISRYFLGCFRGGRGCHPGCRWRCGTVWGVQRSIEEFFGRCGQGRRRGCRWWYLIADVAGRCWRCRRGWWWWQYLIPELVGKCGRGWVRWFFGLVSWGGCRAGCRPRCLWCSVRWCVWVSVRRFFGFVLGGREGCRLRCRLMFSWVYTDFLDVFWGATGFNVMMQKFYYALFRVCCCFAS